jgi:hypothetical protein
MKRLLTLLFALFLVPALAGCDSGSDDDDPNGGGGGGGGGGSTIAATVDGDALTFDSASATFDGGVFQATGIRNNNTDQLTVSVVGAAPGTFTLSPNDPTVTIIYREGATPYQANGVTAAAGASGTVTIDAIDASGASGTFSGTLVNISNLQETISVTDGEFDVSF